MLKGLSRARRCHLQALSRFYGFLVLLLLVMNFFILDPIQDFFIQALEGKWHEDCFNCQKCRMPFVKPEFLSENGLPYCPTCHAVVQGKVCKRCKKGAPNALKAMDTYWHDECFTCDGCNQKITGNFTDESGWPYHSECVGKVAAGNTCSYFVQLKFKLCK